MASRPDGFIALSTLKSGALSSADALGEIRRIYFRTTARTIEHDLAHAIELLKSLDEDARDKAAGYMEGLAELRGEWHSAAQPTRRGRGAPPAARAKKSPKAPRKG